MTGEDIKVMSPLDKAWGHFNSPKTEEERWKILYAEVREEMDRTNEAYAAAQAEGSGWKDRAQKAERALAKIREWIKTVSNEAEAN